MTYGLARYGYGLYLPEFRAAFAISPGAAGAIAAGSYAGYCAAALGAGRFVGRGRGRLVLWAAGGTAALGSVLVAAAWDAASLAAGALVAGSGAGAATPALVAAVAGTVPREGQPRAQGLVNGGTGAGVVAGGLLVVAVPEAWRWCWAAIAVLALGVTAWADRQARWGAGAGDGNGRVPVRALGRPLVAALLAGAGCAGVWTFARDLLTTDGGLSSTVTGLLWCLLGGAGLLGGLSGVLVRRVGLRAAWTGTVAAAAAGTVLLGLLPSAVVPAGVALVVFGSAFVALSGVLLAWGAERVPAVAAAAVAVLFIGLTIGQAAGSVVLGVVSGAAGAPTAFFAAGALLVLAAAVTEPRRGMAAGRDTAGGRSPEPAQVHAPGGA